MVSDRRGDEEGWVCNETLGYPAGQPNSAQHIV